MFHFNFNLEDGLDGTALANQTDQGRRGDSTDSDPQQIGEPFSEIDLDSLLEALPPKISYSFVSTPPSSDDCSSEPQLTLARRDLFDARFQLISEGMNDDPETIDHASGCSSGTRSFESALRFIDAPSDLVPLVYEGGLKTWECSLDLAAYLKRDGIAANARGQRVLELGCGTAIPTLCILQEILSQPASQIETHIHLQDYNTSVLHLVTAPNVLLAWYNSPSADSYRSSQIGVPEAEDNDVESGSELHITPELLQAFKTSVRNHRLRLRFFSGCWDAFEPARTGGHYDLVLTSETIYRSNSLSSLVRVMRDACITEPALSEPPGPDLQQPTPLCLVAAKTIYFGVGGGVAEFVRCVESTEDERGNTGRVETIWEKSMGVSRQVMLVRWT